MRSLFVKVVTVFGVCATLVAAQDAKLKIGIPDLQVAGGDANFAAQASDSLVKIVADLGLYVALSQKDMTDAFGKIKEKFPKLCDDPRCVRAVGSALGLDRMLYGSLDKYNTSYGIKLTLLEVQNSQTIDQVSLESEPGTALTDLLKAAIAKLHGQSDKEIAIKTNRYFGMPVHNEKQMLIATGATIGLSMILAIAQGSLSSMENTAEFDDALSGINTQTSNVPLYGRPAAMANAYVALATDAYGVMYNPAAMAWVNGREASMGYQKRFAGLNLFEAAYVNKAQRDLGFGQAFFYSGDSLSSEMYTVSAFGYKFNELFSMDNPLAVGASIKLANIITPKGPDNDDNQGQKTFGFGMDYGMQLKLSDKIKGGIVFKDLLAFQRVNNTKENYSYVEFQPVIFKWGGVYQVGYSNLLIAEIQTPLYSDQKWIFAGGFEQELFRVFAIRAGIQKEAYFDDPWHFTGGVGLKIPTSGLYGRYIIADVSYEYNTLTAFSDIMNFSLRFGF